MTSVRLGLGLCLGSGQGDNIVLAEFTSTHDDDKCLNLYLNRGPYSDTARGREVTCDEGMQAREVCVLEEAKVFKAVCCP